MMKCFLAIFASAVLASCTGKDLENLQTIVFPNCAPRSIYGLISTKTCLFTKSLYVDKTFLSRCPEQSCRFIVYPGQTSISPFSTVRLATPYKTIGKQCRMPGIACGKSGKVRCTCQTQYISKKIETWVFQRNEETNLWEKVLQTVKFTVPGGCKCTRFMSEYALEREIDG
ncbi:uncharacterized protein LOC120334089 isoform X1 [Styela clava]